MKTNTEEMIKNRNKSLKVHDGLRFYIHAIHDILRFGNVPRDDQRKREIEVRMVGCHVGCDFAMHIKGDALFYKPSSPLDVHSFNWLEISKIIYKAESKIVKWLKPWMEDEPVKISIKE